MPEQTDQPLLSDEQINRLGIAHVDLYHGEAMRAQAGIERGTILPRGWSYMDGVFKARDIYEQARKQDKERIRELQAFKDYVHQRLDEAGIPTHPPGEHMDAGCRVGQRLDIALHPPTKP